MGKHFCSSEGQILTFPHQGWLKYILLVQSFRFCEFNNSFIPEFMVASALQLATRAFVRVLLALAAQYSVSLSVNRDSSDVVLLSAYRRPLKR